ncbi:MAG: S8 family serine peptidase [Candidatus Shapirobacteria bacterium]
MKQINFEKFLIVIAWLFVLFMGVERGALALETKSFSIELPIKSQEDIKPYVPNEVIVKFKKDKINLSSAFSLSSELRKLIFNWTSGYETEETIKSGNLLVLKLKEGQNLNEVLISLRANSNVEYAQPNYIRQISTLSIDDTYKNDLWGLDNVSQLITYDSGETSVGTSGADIDVRRAWAISTGTTEVVVAVLDTGVAIDHPDLVDVLWDGTTCKDENGGALGGCLGGYDYVDNDVDPSPSNFFKDTHGTHVAGTIAAARNNTKGIAGVGPNIKIMALKVGYSGMIDSVAEIKAIDFAIQNGAKIINASYGGPSYDSAQYEAIVRFRTAGGIFVAAAGNDATNNDTGGHSYPSDYTLDNIISVAATDQNDALADFSNYGLTSVDVGAPGTTILSSVSFRKDVIQNFAAPTGLTAGVGSSWALAGSLSTGVTALFADGNAIESTYLNNSDYYITSSTVDLSTLSGSLTKINFIGYCNDLGTTLGGDAAGDYLALEVSGDGSSFAEIYRWNGDKLGSLIDGGCGAYYCAAPVYVEVNDAYLTSSFKYQFHWVTDSSLSTTLGCFINDMKIIDYPTRGANAGYDFEQGTSMAAPHVAGLAGYLWSAKPSATMSEIVTSILTTGDTLAALAGKTTTGRRINAYNAVLGLGLTALTGPSVTGLANDAVPAKSKTLTWSSATPASDQYRFSIDQLVSGVPTGDYGVGSSTTYSSGDGTFYIHVQARDVDLAEGPVATASFILDNTGPSPIVSTSSLNSFVLSFGETLFDSVGTSLGSGFDLSGRFSTSLQIGISVAATSSTENVTIGVTGTPLAGSYVNLLSGTGANDFYDYLTNAGGALAVYFNGDAWYANPTSLSVASTLFPDLITTGMLTLGGSAPETATSITTTTNLIITIGDSGSNSTVGLTAATIITELTDAEFNANLIVGSTIDVSSVSGLDVGYTATGGIQWGIPGTTLKFSQPVIVSLYLGAGYDAQTLNVYRSDSLSVGWTSSGLSTPTCVVSSGYCSFATVEASYFIAASSPIIPTATPTVAPTGEPTATPTLTPTSAPNNNSSNNQAPGPPEPPRCNDRIPLTAPDLFRISTKKGSATIVYTPVNEQITGYAVMYGHKKGDERYAAMISPLHNNQGEQSFTINKLNPKTTYYFKVTAYNGCVSGPWSDWIPAKADRRREIHKYKTVFKNKIRTLINRFI